MKTITNTTNQMASIREDESKQLELFEEDFQDPEFEKLENEWLDLEEIIDRFEGIEEQRFYGEMYYHGTDRETAKRMATRAAEVATGYTKKELLNKRAEFKAQLEKF